MYRAVITSYTSSFRGLSKDVWYLALVTLVNRAGTMVLPFLTKYLKEDLTFTYSQVGWVMVAFGLGSLIGSYLGGKLTDLFGFYKVMVGSLLISGFMFFGLQQITTFWGFCLGILLLMSVADMFRPAMFVSLKAYSKPENQTRSLTLVRLAINLGFSLGPALGGIIIVSVGYAGLFWIDGATCILSILMFVMLVKEKNNTETVIEKRTAKQLSIYKTDRPYFIFLTVSFLMGVVFFQLFTTMPLYHHDVHSLSEWQTGLLLSLNGLLIFLLEMPLVHQLEKQKISQIKIIMWSLCFYGLSYAVLLFTNLDFILVVSVFAISFGEMLGFPYTNAFAMKRAKSGMEGKYLALYTMSFSFAHILSAKIGMSVVEKYGYTTNWVLMILLSILAIGLTALLSKKLALENSNQVQA
ncbi:MAG: MFS transporter [Bacteroidetes bacterium HGW-Bacteroidetes-13]|nr:MAG: MFS transporter [Bacteroidetes bacterium HGW-Bacteroidetes-13]